MSEPSDEEIKRREKMKQEDGVDELMQHWLWLKYKRNVTLAEIQTGPDPLLVRLAAMLDQRFAGKAVVSGSTSKEGTDARRKA